MTTIRDIKSKIKGISSTHKITKSMKIIAQIRYQKALRQLLPLRPYYYRVKEFVSFAVNFLPNDDYDKIELFSEKKYIKTVLVLVVSSDKGLCGAFNSSLFRELEKFINKYKENNVNIKFISIGQKAYSYLSRKKGDIYSNYVNLPPLPSMEIAQEISDECVSMFRSGLVQEVWAVYNSFSSMTKYLTQVERFLPMVPEKFEKNVIIPQYVFEPSVSDILVYMLPQQLRSHIYQILFESNLSEYSARVVAMDMATNAAQKIISNLILTYNKLRQALITKELIEVVSGAEALK